MRSSKSSRTVLLEGLPLKCSNRDLNNHFSKFGPLTECIAMTNKKNGQCRGFGFVSFMWEHHCKVCIETHPHVIRGAKIALRLLDDEEVSEFEQNLPTRKLLISFVGKKLRKFDILDYFSKFGSVNVEIATDGENSPFFAYIVFNDEEMCKNCTRIAEHFITGHRVFIRPAVRKEVYKRAEQAERERLAREEKIKAEEEERLQMQLAHNPCSGNLSGAPRTNQLLMFPPFPSCLVPPPPPPYPLQQPEGFVSPTAIGAAFSNGRPIQAHSSHSWVPLLPASTSGTHPTPGSAASIMAGYGGRQTQEQPVQRTENFDMHHSCTTRNTRNTWARLVDLPVSNSTTVAAYASSPQYYYKT